MNIFINCSNLRFGGGITVAFNFIKYYQENFPNDTIYLIAPSNCGYEKFGGDNVTLEILPEKYNKSIPKLYLNYFLLPSRVKKFKADCVISLGNIAIPIRRPQILLIMFPYIAYPESEVWKRLGKMAKFKKHSIVRTIKTNAKYADEIFVQTETMKKRMSQQLPRMKGKIKVIPCAVSFTSQGKAEPPVRDQQERRGIRLLFLSKYYVHKNFEILFPLAEKILSQKLDITITTTLDGHENEGSAIFLKKVKEKNLGGVIRNIGNVKLEDVAKNYRSHDGLILPTLLESFSGTYIESFYFEKPVFTSDIDFAHDSCKDAAFYFNPLDAADILKTIVEAFDHPATIQEKVDLGNHYLSEYKTWDDIGKIFKTEMDTITASQKYS